MAFSLKIPVAETDQRLFESPELATENGPAVPLLARSILPGILAVAFLACSAFCALAAATTTRTYACSLGATWTLVSALLYMQVYRVRLQLEVPAELSYLAAKKSAILAAAQEMAVDLNVGARFVVVTPLVVLRLLEMSGAVGKLLGSAEWAFAFAILGPLLLVVLRAALDEFVPGSKPGIYNTTVYIFGGVVLTGAIIVYVLLIVDLFQASEASALRSAVEMYAIVLAVYPLVSLNGILLRIALHEHTASSYADSASIGKEVLLVLGDVIGPLLLAFSSACAAFGHQLGDLRLF